jgi:hypothetical protein
VRKKVYICGPISKGDLCHNINQATAAFIALAKAGFAPLCPHWSVYAKPCATYWEQYAGVQRTYCYATAMGNDEMTHEDWMQIDLPWVAASDAVLRLPGESTGADRETAHAREHGVPVFGTVSELVRHFARAGETHAALAGGGT